MNSDQFTLIYNELFLDIYRYVYFRIPHQQDAEDIVSHIFMDAYRRFETYAEEKGTVRQWIFGIARFSVIDYWRDKKSHTQVDFESIEQFLIAVDGMSIEESTDSQRIFDTLMESMPKNVQGLFALRYIDGLTYQEIAEIVGRKPAAVRKLFSLTHQKLRQKFGYLFNEIESPELL